MDLKKVLRDLFGMAVGHKGLTKERMKGIRDRGTSGSVQKRALCPGGIRGNSNEIKQNLHLGE